MLTKYLTPLFACTAATLLSLPLAHAQSSTFPVEAGSWGGKVRTGPGSSFKQVAGLKEGDTVTIVENTGVQMNGFPWFKIEFGDGQSGYKWGGVLCSRNTKVKGTFRQCEGYVASDKPAASETQTAANEDPKATEEPSKVEDAPKPAEDDTAAATDSAADEPRQVVVVPAKPEDSKPDDQTEVAANTAPDQKAKDDTGKKWSYRQFKDESNKGRTASTLTFGESESENVLLQGYCAVGFKGNVSVLRLSSKTGILADAADVKVTFTGNNKTHEFDGTVIAASAEETIAGARITVKNDDGLWETLQEASDVDYQVSTFGAVSLPLADANDAIGSFLADCASYAGKFDEEPSAATAQADPPATPEPLDDKKAFDEAKELDTVEAWEAFLRNFPEGFRADLARAYIKRLKAGGSSTETAASEDTQTGTETQSEAQEETVNLGVGTARWRAFKYQQDEGNTSAQAAGVEANGLELVAYCTPKKRVATILREKKQGVYPDFNGRIERGLKALEAKGGTVPLTFDTGNVHAVPSQVFGLTGEVALGNASKGFASNSRFVRDLMSANQIDILAPPFGASFQLKGSRRALCTMLKRCGVKSPECARYEAPKIVRTEPPRQRRQPRQPRRESRCPRRYVWLEGECVHRRFVAEYCGPGYRRSGSRCVRRRYREPSYDVCPPGFIFDFGRCVPF